MNDSGAARNALASQVASLQKHEIQFWQFMVGQVPNCKDIEPTATSWCGGVSAGIKTLQHTLWLMFALIFLNGGVTHASQIIDVLKWIGK